jgi:hypothetical protein
MLTLDQLQSEVQVNAIRSVCVQQKHFQEITLDKFKSLALDHRINGSGFSALLRDRAITRRMQSDSVYARKIIASNVMHFNAQGHCYSYTLKRFFH